MSFSFFTKKKKKNTNPLGEFQFPEWDSLRDKRCVILVTFSYSSRWYSAVVAENICVLIVRPNHYKIYVSAHVCFSFNIIALISKELGRLIINSFNRNYILYVENFIQ